MCTMTSFKGPKIQVLKHHILYMFTLKISIGSIIFLFAEQILKYLQSGCAAKRAALFVFPTICKNV